MLIVLHHCFDDDPRPGGNRIDDGSPNGAEIDRAPGRLEYRAVVERTLGG